MSWDSTGVLVLCVVNVWWQQDDLLGLDLGEDHFDHAPKCEIAVEKMRRRFDPQFCLSNCPPLGTSFGRHQSFGECLRISCTLLMFHVQEFESVMEVENNILSKLIRGQIGCPQ